VSAYFVDKLHIDVLVSGAIDFACAARLAKGGDLIIAIEENGTELGKMLWAENARSVNYLNALVYQKTNSALEEIVGFYGFE
jgi:hypothetical protein